MRSQAGWNFRERTGMSRFVFIGLSIQPQGNAHLIERLVDPVGMNLDFCDHGGLPGFTLRIDRVELLLQALLC